MSFNKKRKKQNGRQGASEKQQRYQKGFFDGQAKLIDKLIDAGALPKIDFSLKSVYEEGELKE
jgi:hypothetical protein